MRRLLHLVLLAALGLPLLAPLFALAQDSDARLPICCRRAGEHHCAMAAASPGDAPQAHTPWLHCARFPSTTAPAQSSLYSTPSQAVSFRRPRGLGLLLAQTECRRRIARDRSRQKRGPPASFSS